MSGLIRINGNVSKNKAPTFTYARINNISSTTIDFEFMANDVNSRQLEIYIYINGEKKQITDLCKKSTYTSSEYKYFYSAVKLSKNTKYQIYFEAYDGLEYGKSEIFEVTTKEYDIFGVRIDPSNSDPNKCITYIADSTYFTPIKYIYGFDLGSWKDKFIIPKIRVVGFKDGQVTKEIKPFNKKQYIDGETVPQDVDVMVEIPKIYWNFSVAKDMPSQFELRVSETKINDDYVCYSHLSNGMEKDFIYIGCYLGYEENGKLRSKSGVIPTTKKTINEIRNLVKANGRGYQQLSFYTTLLLQILFVIMFKNLNCQRSIGSGYASWNIDTNMNNLSYYKTGANDNAGIFSGGFATSDGNDYGITKHISFLHIEDLWCALGQLCEGIYNDYNSELKKWYLGISKENKNFEDEVNNYEQENTDYNTTHRGFFKLAFLDNKHGFLPKATDTCFKGNSEMYYCDYFSYGARYFIYNFQNYGSDSNGTKLWHSRSGIFSGRFFIDNLDQGLYNVGSRLVYLEE